MPAIWTNLDDNKKGVTTSDTKMHVVPGVVPHSGVRTVYRFISLSRSRADHVARFTQSESYVRLSYVVNNNQQRFTTCPTCDKKYAEEIVAGR